MKSETVKCKKTREETIPKLLTIYYSKMFADIWLLGLQLGLRVNDLLSLKKDIDVNADYIMVFENKKDVMIRVYLNNKAKEIIKRVQSYSREDATYLFQSTSNRATGMNKPLSVSAVGAAFSEIGTMLKMSLNTHSMRKTKGWVILEKTGNLDMVSKALGHDSIASTVAYLGYDGYDSFLTEEQIREAKLIEV